MPYSYFKIKVNELWVMKILNNILFVFGHVIPEDIVNFMRHVHITFWWADISGVIHKNLHLKPHSTYAVTAVVK